MSGLTVKHSELLLSNKPALMFPLELTYMKPSQSISFFKLFFSSPDVRHGESSE